MKDKPITWEFKAPQSLDTREPIPQHFYASSAAEWKCDTDPASLVSYMKRQGRWNFSLWWVPVDITANYQINYYAPQVEGAKLLGTYTCD